MANTTEKPINSALALLKVSVSVPSRSLTRSNLISFIVPKNATMPSMVVPPSANVAAT